MARKPVLCLLLGLAAVHVGCAAPSSTSDATSSDSNLDESPWKVVKTVGVGPGMDIVEQEKSAIAVDKSGNAHVVYTGRDGLTLSIVAPDGVSRDETIDAQGETGRYVAIALGADGSEHIAYFENGPTVALKYAERKSDGTWALETISGAAESPSIAVDGDGTTHVTWFDYGKKEIDYASRPEGGAWSAVEKVDASDDGAAAIGVTQGEVHVVYAKALQGGVNDGQRASDGTWSSAPLALGDKLGPVAMATDASGALHVAASRLDGSSQIVYATRPAGGAWSAPEIADTNAAVGGSYHVAIAVDDGAQMVRIVASGDDQPILREADRANGAWTGLWIGQEGDLPSLAVDAAGAAHLTYRTADSTFVYAKRAR